MIGKAAINNQEATMRKLFIGIAARANKI